MHHPTNRITHTTAFVTPVASGGEQRGGGGREEGGESTRACMFVPLRIDWQRIQPLFENNLL